MTSTYSRSDGPLALISNPSPFSGHQSDRHPFVGPFRAPCAGDDRLAGGAKRSLVWSTVFAVAAQMRVAVPGGMGKAQAAGTTAQA